MRHLNQICFIVPSLKIELVLLLQIKLFSAQLFSFLVHYIYLLLHALKHPRHQIHIIEEQQVALGQCRHQCHDEEVIQRIVSGLKVAQFVVERQPQKLVIYFKIGDLLQAEADSADFLRCHFLALHLV